MEKVLITGGAGYIGSTVASCCHDAGIVPVILDDLSTGSREFAERFAFYEGDIGDTVLVERILDEHPEITAVVHCAARIVVAESLRAPLEYYETNVAKAVTLVRSLAARGVDRVILSSTAAVYDASSGGAVDETSPLDPRSPYAASKQMLERVLRDSAAVDATRTISLRYFNPIGADPLLRSGQQDPHPTHALGRLVQAHRERTPFSVTGTEWPTRDGSGLRDYIHVWDLARAHVAALRRFDEIAGPQTDGFEVINLGTGTGTTVFELVRAFEEVVGDGIPVIALPPRPGDQAGCVPSSEKAERMLDWRAEFDVRRGISDSLAWIGREPAIV